MSKLAPLDLAFLLMENPSRQLHMAAYQLFKMPARQKSTFVAKVLEAYRNSEVGKPFNQRLKWLDKGVASWETVEPDLRYHIRHIAVPAPGSMEDFYEIVSFLNTTLLDRARPLWECYVIDGLENDQFAVFVKVHHSLIDGGGALKLFESSLNTTATSKDIRAVWTPVEKSPRRKRSRAGQSQVAGLLSKVSALPSSLLGAGLSIADLGAQNLRLKPQKSSLPFGAQKTAFNNTPESSARRYANCEIPLEQIKAISAATDTTVNDVVMTVIDHALNQYLEEHNAAASAPLVTMMAMSFRSADGEASGNQVSAELVPLGEPDAAIAKRLQQIHDSTTRIKKNSGSIPVSVRQLYSLVIFGTGTLPEFASAFAAIPNANLLISNMIGPRKQLYLGGAPLVAFHGLPIVPPGCGLNVTFATVNQTICLAVGAAPEAMDNPYHLTQLVMDAVSTLEKAVAKTGSGKTAPKSKAARKSPAKKRKSKAGSGSK